MEDKGLTDILSNLIPHPKEENLNIQDVQTEEQDNAIAEGLETLAGRSGGELKTAIDEFLKGKGELLESTRSALAIDKKSAEKSIIDLLIARFNLSPTLAAVIAPMLLKLIPGAEKKKRRTSTKRKKKTTPSAKRKTGTKKKKSTASAKKKKTTTKKPKKKTATTRKKKPANSTNKKTTTTKKTKPKSSTKSQK